MIIVNQQQSHRMKYTAINPSDELNKTAAATPQAINCQTPNAPQFCYRNLTLDWVRGRANAGPRLPQIMT